MPELAWPAWLRVYNERTDDQVALKDGPPAGPEDLAVPDHPRFCPDGGIRPLEYRYFDPETRAYTEADAGRAIHPPSDPAGKLPRRGRCLRH